MENRSFTDVGGIPGGIGHFLLGFAMAGVGGFLITHQVSIVGSYWSFWGGSISAARYYPCCLVLAF